MFASESLQIQTASPFPESSTALLNLSENFPLLPPEKMKSATHFPSFLNNESSVLGTWLLENIFCSLIKGEEGRISLAALANSVSNVSMQTQ